MERVPGWNDPAGLADQKKEQLLPAFLSHT